MKVKDLIKKLSEMPPEAEVLHLWDGGARTNIELVWLSNGGDVVTSDFDDPCYNELDRPVNAPSAKQEPYWRTEERPTPRALDAGDSAASQALSPRLGESTPEVNLAATQRK